MAFLHGLSAADMEVKLAKPGFSNAPFKREWERSFIKYIQEEVMIDAIFVRNFQNQE